MSDGAYSLDAGRFSEATKRIFEWAWSTAVLQRHSSVTEDHILAGLLFFDHSMENPILSEELAVLAGKVDSFELLIGALARVARLSEAAAPPSRDNLVPLELVIDWLREADRCAVGRNDTQDIEPEDLVEVFRCSDCDNSTRNRLLRRLKVAGEAGRVRSQTEKARQASESTYQTANRHRTETREGFNILAEQFSNELTAVKGRLDKVTFPEGFPDGLPGIKPPHGAWLTLAMVCVAALGVTVGLALNNIQLIEIAISHSSNFSDLRTLVGF